MMKSAKIVAYCVAIAGLLYANVQAASASRLPHNWWAWHWDKSTIYVAVWSYQSQARAAIRDWNDMTDLRLPELSSHTNISVWGANYGATGWGGLASIESYSWDWHCWWWCKIDHAHARFNSYYSGWNSWWARGVFCQEVGHTFGLDHNNSGGCMGLGYYAGSSNRPSSHDVSDVNSKY